MQHAELHRRALRAQHGRPAETGCRDGGSQRGRLQQTAARDLR